MMQDAKAVERLPEETEERLPFDEEQVKALLAAAKAENNDEWRGMVLFGYHAGLRLTDSANLTWDNKYSRPGERSLSENPLGRRNQSRTFRWPRSGTPSDARRLFSGHHPFNINHFSLSSIVHGFAEFGGNPGFLMFDHETHHFGPLFLREGANLLDYFYGTHPLDIKPDWPSLPRQLCLLISSDSPS
jgi:hypothetical protein